MEERDVQVLVEDSLVMLDMILAYGPIGGIDPGVAVKWVVIWTVVMSLFLYGSLAFFPNWVELEDEHHQAHH